MYLLTVYDEPLKDNNGKVYKKFILKRTFQFLSTVKFYKQYYESIYPDKEISIKKRYKECWKEVKI